MIIRSNRRAGFSLTEALIAMFIMALGLMGVLALFPLGAIHMLSALKDDRTSQANHTASTRMRQYWRDEVFKQPLPPNFLPQNPTQPGPVAMSLAQYSFYRDPFILASLDVNAAYVDAASGRTIRVLPPYASTTTPPLSPYLQTPSYPVFLDPIGWNNAYETTVNPAMRFWVAGRSDCIPRRSLTAVQFGQISLQGGYVQLDDIGFGRDGTPQYPDDPTGQSTSNTLGFNPMLGQIQRDGRYSWAFMLKRPKTINWDQSDLAVVVYNGRTVDGPSEEIAYPGATFTAGSTEVVMPYSGSRPKVRKGTWILDATMTRPSPTGNIAEPHGFFYRVVNVNDENPGFLILELQTPAEMSSIIAGTPYGMAVVLDNVAEVFERKTLTKVIEPVP